MRDRKEFVDGSPVDRLEEQLNDFETRLTNSQVNDLAEKAANKAISKMWLSLGYDLRESDDIRELNADLAYMRMQRATYENARGWVLKFFVMSVLGFVAWAITKALHR